ncbi:hypothetical protein B0H16DRAFT_104795 [Mycena metata]|uniref:Uncharacterized protein n=1 Tax=Mycena metata TaxID=1033252 RepID=A0AAD7I8M7_9AGAR|nr:hypothetical protein B0H16DRAFT_104795 [Mycena metata]
MVRLSAASTGTHTSPCARSRERCTAFLFGTLQLWPLGIAGFVRAAGCTSTGAVYGLDAVPSDVSLRLLHDFGSLPLSFARRTIHIRRLGAIGLTYGDVGPRRPNSDGPECLACTPAAFKPQIRIESSSALCAGQEDSSGGEESAADKHGEREAALARWGSGHGPGLGGRWRWGREEGRRTRKWEGIWAAGCVGGGERGGGGRRCCRTPTTRRWI